MVGSATNRFLRFLSVLFCLEYGLAAQCCYPTCGSNKCSPTTAWCSQAEKNCKKHCQGQLCSGRSSLVAERLVSAARPDRPLAPPVPHTLACISGVDGRSVRASCMVDLDSTDKVDFGVILASDPQAWAHVHYVVNVAPDGSAQAIIPGLVSGAKYKLTARAHHRNSSEGWAEKWSAVATEIAECQPSDTGRFHYDSRSEPKRNRRGNLDMTSSTWVTMYRFRGPGYAGALPAVEDYDLPDFLDNHNSADANKMLGRWANPDSCPEGKRNLCSITRYCVEILDVHLTTSLHSVGIGGPTKTSTFANYISCDKGDCHCPNKWDAFQLENELEMPREWVDNSCPLHGNCRCDNEQLQLSMNYTGRWTFYPPFSEEPWMDAQGNPHGGYYDGKAHESGPEGYFYSSPEDTSCPVEAEVGSNGCTWKRSPLMHTISVQQLLEGGVWGGIPHPRKTTTEEELHSKEIAEELYKQVGALPCGELLHHSSVPDFSEEADDFIV